MAAPIGTRAGKRKTDTPAPAATIDPKHNQSPEQIAREKEEAEKVQLISFMHKYREARALKLKKKADLDEAAKGETDIARLAKAALGINRKQMDAYLEDMSASKRDLLREEQTRRKHRSWLGILTGEQIDLFNSDAPEDKKDEATIRGEGYSAGVRQDQRAAPAKCVGADQQAWLEAYDAGYKYTADALQAAIEAEQNRRTADLEKQAGVETAAESPEPQAEQQTEAGAEPEPQPAPLTSEDAIAPGGDAPIEEAF